MLDLDLVDFCDNKMTPKWVPSDWSYSPNEPVSVWIESEVVSEIEVTDEEPEPDSQVDLLELFFSDSDKTLPESVNHACKGSKIVTLVNYSSQLTFNQLEFEKSVPENLSFENFEHFSQSLAGNLPNAVFSWTDWPDSFSLSGQYLFIGCELCVPDESSAVEIYDDEVLDTLEKAISEIKDLTPQSNLDQLADDVLSCVLVELGDQSIDAFEDFETDLPILKGKISIALEQNRIRPPKLQALLD